MSNEVAVTNQELSAELLDLTAEDTGKGVSFKQEDQLLPLIYVLQGLSPQVQKRGDSHIEGAEPGHFWLKNSLTPIWDGEKGIEVIPCEMVRTWIEWLPNRGGFVARHEAPPADTIQKTMRDDAGAERQMLVRSSNGNTIQDTREFYIIAQGQPYVLPCTGTKHTFARQWQTYFHQYHHPKTGGVMPSFSRKYRLTTTPVTNAKGEWFGLKFEDLGLVSLTEYQNAKKFYEAVKKGEKKADIPDAAHDGGSTEIPF